MLPLIDDQILDSIVQSIDSQKNDYFIEIGSGKGALTDRLYRSELNLKIIAINFLKMKILKY